jgi:hypothetical protein
MATRSCEWLVPNELSVYYAHVVFFFFLSAATTIPTHAFLAFYHAPIPMKVYYLHFFSRILFLSLSRGNEKSFPHSFLLELALSWRLIHIEYTDDRVKLI